MHFTQSALLLAALTSGALAGRHGHYHGRHEGHARRQAEVEIEVDNTVTVTAMSTLIACPCTESSSVLATPTPVAAVEVLTSSTPVWSSSTFSSVVVPTTTITIESSSSTFVSSTSTVESTSSTTEPSASTAAPSTTTYAATSTSDSSNAAWTATPSSGEYSTAGFGIVTNSSGSGDTYIGNVGSPYGSNILKIDSSVASEYKYVVEFTGSNTEDWLVVIWNKYSEDGTMDGWYGNACHNFTIASGETVYYAFDVDSQGGWAAHKGSIPTNDYGSYASTWGEFDFGSTTNDGWSGFDVSAITAQEADMSVQGMKICSKVRSTTCSSITTGTGTVSNAYTSDLANEGGIGGNLSAGPIRLAVTLDYSG
jgi:Predicted solute binding protein